MLNPRCLLFVFFALLRRWVGVEHATCNGVLMHISLVKTIQAYNPLIHIVERGGGLPPTAFFHSFAVIISTLLHAQQRRNNRLQLINIIVPALTIAFFSSSVCPLMGRKISTWNHLQSRGGVLGGTQCQPPHPPPVSP